MDKKPNTILSIIALIGAVVGIIVMFAYRAWLGGLIYIAAAMVADYLLRSCLKDENGKNAQNFVFQYIFDRDFSVPEYVSGGFKSKYIIKKIISAIVTLLPLVVLVATIMWIFVDTNREVDEAFKEVDAALDELYDMF